jgi:uncharacterized protein YfaS (alpha-2-macroglobulin family)
MQTKTKWCVILSIASLCCFAARESQAQNSNSPSRAAMWKKVDEAIQKGLPKTAIEELKPIEAAALQDKAYPEAIKAMGKRMMLSSQIEGGQPDDRIRQMTKEIESAPKEMLPTMHVLLGSWYWDYFQQNRWQFANRTATSVAPGEDFSTWDLKRLFAEIDKHYAIALQSEDELKKIPIATYDALLEKGTLPDSYRPTLFDFLAHIAIEFYASGEQAGAKAEDSFEIDASSPALGTAPDFLAWKPTTTDEGSPKLKAIVLFQKLLNFHDKDTDRSAWLDTELDRLRFANANAVGEEKESRYIAALKNFSDTHSNHPLSSTARFRWASALHGQNELVEARKIALQGKNAFPTSTGGIQCSNLINSIEYKSVAIVTERVWAEPLPPIRVTYRNISKVYFRVVKADWLSRFTTDRWLPNQFNQADVDGLLKMPPVASWDADLPPTTDYRNASHDVSPPKGLKLGYYIVLVSTRQDFSDTENIVSATEVWVTNLALVIRQSSRQGKLEGFVLNAESGEPISGAKVRVFRREENNRKLVEGTSVTTNANGLFTVTENGRGIFLLASHAANEIASMSEHFVQSYPNPSADRTKFVFFTDRSIYRPGQTVHFKGIKLSSDTDKDKYEVLAGHKVEVSFRDPNNKEISALTLTSNDYGSFSGSFTAPRDRGTGRMSIVVSNRNEFSTSFQVEEYKRPKFEVSVDPPKDAVKLGKDVVVTGKAIGYTGVPIQGAKVRYRVTREVRWPMWFRECYFWRMPPNPGQSQEIAHGWATSEADGTFRIPFVANPDRSVPEKDEPTFHYTVIADVTDSTGETRTGTTSISVGYTTIAISLAAEDWQVADKDLIIKIATKTLDGKPQSAKGTLRIHRLKEPAKVERSDLLGGRIARERKGMVPTMQPDSSDPRTWGIADAIETVEFETKDGSAELKLRLPRGLYRAVAESQDSFSKPITALLNLRVLDPSANQLGLKVPNVLAAPEWKLEPGESLKAIWGSGYDKARAYIEVEHRGKLLQSYWTKLGVTQVAIEQAVNEAMRGGFTVRTTSVRENRAYLETRHVDVPWSNKELTLKWEHFVSKLEPAAKETFTLTIQGPGATKAAAEMVATLYDASLDAYAKHQWMQRLQVFRYDYSGLNSGFNNGAQHLSHLRGRWNPTMQSVSESYRGFPAEFRMQHYYPMTRSYGMGVPGAGGGGMRMKTMRGAAMGGAMLEMQAEGLASHPEKSGADDYAIASVEESSVPVFDVNINTAQAPPSIDLSKVAARTNLNETAFFFPHLLSSKEGEVKMEFTMPEALTKWRFLAFAHDTELRSGFLEDSLVTSKDLMVQPNPPRFLREGDSLEFSVKVSNRSNKPQTGKVALQLFDARTNESVDTAFANSDKDKSFEISAGESKSFAWKLAVPDGAYPIVYKAIGATEKQSDGEEGMLPVLSKRILVTESLPLPIRGKSTREFEFKKLLESANSDTLQHQSLSVQMTSQPAWYAVLALPYLMEYPHECSEQTFNRLYANTLARHIAKSDPKIHRVFETWRQFQPAALNSPLSKNQDVKSVMIEETPWLRDADKESESRRNVGLLFDDNRLDSEVERAFRRLAEMQRDNGMWPWFPGGPDNEYLSLYIVTGFGRLKHLGVAVESNLALKSLDRLDAWVHEQYDRIQRESKNPEDNHLSSTIALYLYGRSFFVEERPIAEQHRVALDYWQRQARKYWLSVGNRQSQAHIAIGLQRMGDKETPKAILASIKEHSVTNEEMGIFWRDTERSWWWYHAPIETQAVMIEAMDEVAQDAAAVEGCKVWLLKQKQTQNWKTTKGTADAVYSLLLRGNKMLSSDALVQVKLADQVIQPVNVEAGTGFYEQKLLRGEVKAEMGKITLTKSDEGVSWGSVHWQYLEDISKVTPHEATPLKLEKKLYKRTLTKSGPVLEPVSGPLEVGDEIVCRIVLRTDRDMEYVHLKDHRGSGTEPVNVLSHYKFQDGLAYYESTRDTASHFFIDYLRKGNYVFEYTLRIQHAGRYPSGMANIECMYAPEFNSHSESIMMEVR